MSYRKALLHILLVAGIAVPFSASAEYQCWNNIGADPAYITLQPSNANVYVSAGQLCANNGGKAVYDDSAGTWINLNGSVRLESPFATSYDCPAGNTYSSAAQNGQGGCVPLPTGYTYNNLLCREPSGQQVSVQNETQCDTLNGTLMNDSSSPCDGQWISQGSGWVCQPLTLTHPSQLSDACKEKPKDSCTAAENAFLSNIGSVQSTGFGAYTGRDYTCQPGFTWFSGANGGVGGCVPMPTVSTPTNSTPSTAQPTNPTPSAAAPQGFCTGGTCTYTPLEPLPGLGSATIRTPQEFGAYLNNAFKLFIILGGMLAVATFVFGGISYMVSDVAGKKEFAKSQMRRSIFGILILLGSYLLLATINPELVRFNFRPESINNPNAAAPSSNMPGQTNVAATQQQLQAQIDACQAQGKTPQYTGTGYQCP